MLRFACNVNFIIVIMLVIEIRTLVAAADLKPTTIDSSAETLNMERVEEYFIEHKVSKTEAATSFQQKSKELLNSEYIGNTHTMEINLRI